MTLMSHIVVVELLFRETTRLSMPLVHRSHLILLRTGGIFRAQSHILFSTAWYGGHWALQLVPLVLFCSRVEQLLLGWLLMRSGWRWGAVQNWLFDTSTDGCSTTAASLKHVRVLETYDAMDWVMRLLLFAWREDGLHCGSCTCFWRLFVVATLKLLPLAIMELSGSLAASGDRCGDLRGQVAMCLSSFEGVLG